MSQNIIHLLPDAVANQIAAGEVIQRPASVIKELMENAIDAGATDVKVSVQDAGRTLILVSDNGCGMNETDARLAFERHATSKISKAEDLYSLCTMGFRGEALASIAAVAQVELVTRQEDSELGLKLCIEGSEVVSQEPCAAPKGSKFSIKNLFYNIPARRRFLKSDSAELRQVTQEFLRVVLAHPQIACSLSSNGQPLFTLAAGNIKQRVAGVAGLSMAKHLLAIEAETDLVHVCGFIGTPETARKTGGDQYFFANNRYMRSPAFNKAVVEAYKGIIAPDHVPAYYIYMEVDPQSIDVNVHPQKTEIKFDNEQAVWQILHSAVKACLNDNHILPSIDFDSGERIEIPLFNGSGTPSDADDAYNPFVADQNQAESFAKMMAQGGFTSSMMPPSASAGSSSHSSGGGFLVSGVNGSADQYAGGGSSWESSFDAARSHQSQGSFLSSAAVPTSQGAILMSSSVNSDSQPDGPDSLFQSPALSSASVGSFSQYKLKYIMVARHDGLMIIDQHRAHERVLYDKTKALLEAGRAESQQLMYPEPVPMGAEDLCIVEELSAELASIGIDVAVDAQAGLANVTSVPPQLKASDVPALLMDLVADCRTGGLDVRSGAMPYILRQMARKGALHYGQRLTTDEMANLYDKLMASPERKTSPSGKPIYHVLADADIDRLF